MFNQIIHKVGFVTLPPFSKERASPQSRDTMLHPAVDTQEAEPARDLQEPVGDLLSSKNNDPNLVHALQNNLRGILKVTIDNIRGLEVTRRPCMAVTVNQTTFIGRGEETSGFQTFDEQPGDYWSWRQQTYRDPDQIDSAFQWIACRRETAS